MDNYFDKHGLPNHRLYSGNSRMMTFQQLILTLQNYWAEKGCVVLQPYDMEMGAGTFHTATFLRALGPERWHAAYVQPSRRPRMVAMATTQTVYNIIISSKWYSNPIHLIFKSCTWVLKAIGIDTLTHDVRFVEDNWESPTLGAWGLGWEVWLNGMEVTQFTYFQQVGGIECFPVTGEITYGLERLAMYIKAWTVCMTWYGRMASLVVSPMVMYSTKTK